ncbi:MAG: SDR family NAD(P)-dependent oxidoreductase [archaeon]|nr:SDR family NAD(P)-dependent oxidoreductase [archaeon]
MKTAFITGGGKGLGKGFSDFFLKQGFQVFIGVLSLKEVEPELAKQKNLVIVTMDVSSDDSIKKAFNEVKSKTDNIDFLINNAGLNKDSATNNHKELVCNLKDLDRKSLLKMFDINSVSPMLVLKEFVALMKSNPSFVINITSGRSTYNDELDFLNNSGNYGYKSSKAALNLMTFASVYDLPSNVKTFAVHPGNVLTEMNQRGTDNPEIQAGKVIDITSQWKEEFNGKFLRFDGTLYKLQ